MLKDLDIEVLSARKAGVYDEVIEDKDTFEGNALKKAQYVARESGYWAVSDDSGICIEALDGKPGVWSARWAGLDAGDEDIIDYTLKKMKHIPDGERNAYFESVAVLSSPRGDYKVFKGQVYGRISFESKGRMRKKLPYDVIFIPKGYKKTFAEMTDVEKNALSHRGLAFKELKEFLKNKS